MAAQDEVPPVGVDVNHVAERCRESLARWALQDVEAGRLADAARLIGEEARGGLV